MPFQILDFRIRPQQSALSGSGRAVLMSGGGSMWILCVFALHCCARATQLSAVPAATAPLAADGCALSKTGCALCHEIIEGWNALSTPPTRADAYCESLAPKWIAMYETLTGKPHVETRERARVSSAHGAPPTHIIALHGSASPRVCPLLTRRTTRAAKLCARCRSASLLRRRCRRS